MKIAFIVEKFPALTETFILNQVIGLIELGHEINIYAYYPDDTNKLHSDVIKYGLLSHTHYMVEVPENYIFRVLQAIWLIIINLKKAPLAVLRSLNFFKYGKPAISLRLFYSILAFLDSQTYDIIHCQFGMYGIEGMRLRELAAIRGKLITCFRGYDISWYIKEFGDDIYKELFTKGDFFLTNCNFFRERAIKLGCEASKIIVHGSGIDCDRFAFKARYISCDRQIRIVTIGRLIEKKGIEYSIRAVAKILKDYPNLEYNIIGEGYLKKDFQQLINKFDIKDKIHLLGWKNQQEIIETLDNSHIFIAPSVTAINGNQDAPVNTLKEAMAMGLPVIGTYHGGIPELVEDGISGFLVPERDANAIANKIIYLIEHPEIWLSMGKAGRSYVEKHYNIHQLNQELIEVYKQVSGNIITRTSNQKSGIKA
ncbi:glycosyltransferase [Brunnivagina elsteri]|uniref:Colanic acid biosynthesis glycosyltransferase WcaL n=1 Tax=Brunnivagina elsteri CCALA 953 TaxID=987040 RepID=A0A2A2TCQ2_9CYAN|nr:glycosyltransferase [Calothrix elsteri]PAX51492.1 colanic acid biosynthesis glycosyltransferase WcaL [Calothrix elsteri CCALA 953]